MCDFCLALATQRVQYHRIAGATEIEKRAMEIFKRISTD